MHGLINRAVQCFLRDTYGSDLWRAVAEASAVGPDGFEAMLTYDDALTDLVLQTAASRLGRPVDVILEDLGTYLVSHPNLEGLRRLLRFGGVEFVDFLYSLDDLPGRGRLAVSDLDLPKLELHEDSASRFSLVCRASHPGYANVMVGVLRAMADDYGALVLMHLEVPSEGTATIGIDLLEKSFAAGRPFDLAGCPPVRT